MLLDYLPNRLILAVSISMLCYACGNNGAGRLPISPQQLVPLLADIHLVEGASQGYPTALKDSVLEVYYDQVFEMHAVSEMDFEKAVDYLSTNPKLAQQIYSKVTERLEELDEKK